MGTSSSPVVDVCGAVMLVELLVGGVCDAIVLVEFVSVT